MMAKAISKGAAKITDGILTHKQSMPGIENVK